MLALLDAALERFLQAEVPLPSEVSVAFDTPDRAWGAGVSGPTINAFLWDVRENMDERQAGVQQVVKEDGRVARHRPFPSVDCRYFVSAWTSEIRDEHRLLGDLLAVFLARDHIAPEYLHPALLGDRPSPRLRLVSLDGERRAEFFSALGGRLKPGLDIVVTALVQAADLHDAGVPVQRFRPRTSARRQASARMPMSGRAAAFSDGQRT